MALVTWTMKLLLVDLQRIPLMALPIWANYYKKLYADETLNVSKEEFEKPENINIRIDCDKKVDENPVVSFANLKEKKQVEDAYVFEFKNKFYMVMRDMGVFHPHVGLILESKDGINWSEPKLGYKTSADYFGGEIERFERPQVLMKNGKPTYLFLALMGGKYNTSSGAVLKIDNKKF